MKQAILVVITAAILLLAAWLGKPLRVVAQPPTPQELPEQTPSAARGQATFEARCTRCHGSTGAGDGAMASDLPAPPPSFLDMDHKRQVTPADYFNIITQGNLEALMPPWGNELSTQERWDVAYYVWSLGTTPENIQLGEKVYNQECAACHGDSGDKVTAANLADQASLAILSQVDLVAKVRDGHADVDWKDTLTDDERWAVADYVRTFTYDTVFSAQEITEDGVIEGKVVDGTAGAQFDLSDLELTLFTFVGQTTHTTITGTVAADGSFRFENLARGTDRTYGLQARYRGVDYLHPDLIDLTQSNPASITLPVYETTMDGSAIGIDRHHVILDFANNQLQVAELYIFNNPGDKTYIGNGTTLKLALPDGVQNLQFDDPSATQSTEVQGNVVLDSRPVPPGSRQVLLSYSLPYSGQSTVFEKPIQYATQNLNVLVSDVGVKVDAGPLVAGEPVSTQSNVRFLNFSEQNVAAGEKLSLKLTNLPRGTGSATARVPADQSGTLRWFGLGFVALALMFILGYPALRPRLLAGAALEENAADVVLRQQRQMLLEELAALDDAYEAGEVAENNYIDSRAEIKADLIDVLDQLRVLETSDIESYHEEVPETTQQDLGER